MKFLSNLGSPAMSDLKQRHEGFFFFFCISSILSNTAAWWGCVLIQIDFCPMPDLSGKMTKFTWLEALLPSVISLGTALW